MQGFVPWCRVLTRSANKGGVTSSSLEVLSALALSDQDFAQHMAVKDSANPPPFYSEYVAEVQSIIRRNADLEFECLWAEHERTLEPQSILSDRLSLRITTLSVIIENSETLWGNLALRNKVLFVMQKLTFRFCAMRSPRPLSQLLALMPCLPAFPRATLGRCLPATSPAALSTRVA